MRLRRHIASHGRLSQGGSAGMTRNITIPVVLLLIGIALVGAAIALRPAPDVPPRFRGALAEFKPQASPAPVAAASFLDADGKKLNLSGLHGRLTLVNVWATWCQPCVAELPSLEKLKRDKAGDRFDVVTISEDRNGALAVGPFFQKHGLKALPQYVDPETNLSRDLGLAGLPTTILLDAQGRELGRIEGDADWDGAQAQALIDWYLKHGAGGAAG